MRRNRLHNLKRIICIVMTVFMAITSLNTVSFASENTISSDVDAIELSEEVSEELKAESEEIQEEVQEEITQFQEVEPIETEYKLGLERLKEEFPEEIIATNSEGEEIKIEVEDWIPITNYDEKLGTYEFEPVIKEELLSDIEEVELPVLKVAVNDESEGTTQEFLDEDLGYEVPELNSVSRDALPAKFDGFLEGYLPEVKNQGAGETCWAFASIGVVEADLIKNSNENKDEIDLSELHLAYFETHQFDDPKDCHDGDTTNYTSATSPYYTNGGTGIVAYRLFENGVGPVEEKYAPYSQMTSYEPAESDAVMSNYAKVLNAYTIPTTDPTGIKKAIYNHGAVTASYYSNEQYYSATYNSFYMPSTSTTNHEIMLVGWDDNFPRENFISESKPSANGAWLVRNSWGCNDYSYKGYFWISYEDAGILRHPDSQSSAYVISYEATTETYSNTYSYCAQPTSTGTASGTGIEVQNKYTVDGGEAIKAVGVEVGSTNDTLLVSVTDGKRTATGSVNTSYSGFYTVKLDEPLEITEKTDVTVTITLKTSDVRNPAKILLESVTTTTYGKIEYKGVTSYKEQIVKIDGVRKSTPRDVRMALYTDNKSNVHGEKFVAFKTLSSNEHKGATLQLEVTDDSTINLNELTFTSTDPGVATVSTTGLVTFVGGKGSSVIRGQYTDPETGKIYYAECSVKTNPYFLKYVVGEDVVFTSKNTSFYPGATNPGSISKAYRQGYSLEGWYLDEALTKKLTSSMISDGTAFAQGETVEVYPKWEECELTVYVIDAATKVKSPLVKLTISTMPYQLENGHYFSNENLTNIVNSIAAEAFDFKSVIKKTAGNYERIYENRTEYTIYKATDEYLTIKFGNIEASDRAAYEKLDEEAKTKMWIGGVPEEAVYTGKRITFDTVNVYYGVRKLTYGTDYTLSYSNNVKASRVTNQNGKILAKGKNGYSSASAQKEFKIVPASIDNSNNEMVFKAADIFVKYNNKAITGKTTLYCNGKALTYNTDYKLENNVQTTENPDGYDVIIHGVGNYSEDLSVKMYVMKDKKSISSATITFEKKSSSYDYANGSIVTPSIIVKYGKKTLVSGTDYELRADTLGSEIGTVTAVIRGKGEYYGEKSFKYKIKGTSINSVKITGFVSSFVYSNDPEQLKQKDMVLAGEKPLVLDTDYTLTYSGIDKAGTATVTIKGIGAYTGTRKKNYKITRYNISDDFNERVSIKVPEKVPYQKGGAKPLPEVTYKENNRENTLTLNTDYRVSYQNNAALGTATIAITGKGNYSGTIKKNFVVEAQQLGSDAIKLYVNDKLYSTKPDGVMKAGGYKTTFYFIDSNDRKLTPGVDYDSKNISYKISTYSEEDKILGPKDTVNEGVYVTMTVQGKGKYTGTASGSYRILNYGYDINQYTITVNTTKQYTGSEICLSKNDITFAKPKGDKYLKNMSITVPGEADFEIISYSYTNNINKGYASVTIKGSGESSGGRGFGGIKTIKFKIVSAK